MHRVSLCLVTLFVCAACITEPETTIQVQGTVTAADDGSPIAGATVQVIEACCFGSGGVRARDKTNNQGDYSLSFIKTGHCPEIFLNISASAPGFQSVTFVGFQIGEPVTPHVRCTNEPQTIDFQLERETTASTIWMRR